MLSVSVDVSGLAHFIVFARIYVIMGGMTDSDFVIIDSDDQVRLLKQLWMTGFVHRINAGLAGGGHINRWKDKSMDPREGACGRGRRCFKRQRRLVYTLSKTIG